MPPVDSNMLAVANATLKRSQELLAEAATFSEKLFEKSQVYNNAIILAGYGGLFVLLAATAKLLPREILSAVAILLGASLLIYIGYLIYNMYVMSITMLKLARKQIRNTLEVHQTAGLDTTEISKGLIALEWNIRLWKIVWITAVATGVGAGTIMMIYYVGALLRET